MPASEQGVTYDRYMAIPRTLIFLTRGDNVSKNEVLLIKGAPHKRLWANRYNGIGGHIERGENVLSAASRELREETGMISPDLRLCGTITIDTGRNPGILLFVFTGTCPNGNLTGSVEGKPEWLPVDQLTSIPLVEDLLTLLPRVLAHREDMPPFAGRYWYDKHEMMIEFST
jgi:8-oxo-dGTP diphosphatase